MNCNAVKPLLSQYIDGDLKEAQTKGIETHLRSCRHCQSEMEALGQVKKAVNALPSRTPPPGFSKKIMSRIREEETKPAPLWERLFLPFHIKIPIQGMALILMTVLAVYLYRDNPGLQEEMTQMTSPESRVFREDSKLKENKKTPKTVLRMEKDEAPSETITSQSLKKKHSGSELTFDQQQKMLEEAETQDPVSQESSSRETRVLSEKMITLEKGTSPRQRQIRSTDDERVLFLNVPTQPETIRGKIRPLLQNMGGEYFKPEMAADSSNLEDPSSEEILWIRLPASHLDQFKTALASLGHIDEEAQHSKRRMTSQLKKDLSASLRIKVIVRSTATEAP